MSIPRKACPLVVLCCLTGVVFGCVAAGSHKVEPQAELERLTLLVSEVQPKVAELAGFTAGEPVKVVVTTRRDLTDYLVRTMEMGYPDGELYRRSQCLSRIGLLPEDYDLTVGMTELVAEQAGGLYDPYGKAFHGILDLPPALRSPAYQNLIASHELTHALQDRVVDIVEESKVCLENLDYEYAFRSVIEGMATVVMLAYTENVAIDDLADTRPIMRTGFAQKADGRTPVYLKELLISPYAEGGAFVQAWRRANPDKDLAVLMKNIPASSEQVLHPEKYIRRDDPTTIDLECIKDAVPAEWGSSYSNILGEFDLLTLFTIHEETSEDATEIACGWDGLGFQGFHDMEGNLVIIGSSVWDSVQDAEEFRVGFVKVLGGVGPPGSFMVIRTGKAVDFVIGRVEDSVKEHVLTAMNQAR